MDLKTYIKLRKLSKFDVAQDLKITLAYLYEILGKRTVPGRKLAQRIVKWSNGDMEIRGRLNATSLAMTTAMGVLWRSGGGFWDEDYVESFSGIPDLNLSPTYDGSTVAVHSREDNSDQARLLAISSSASTINVETAFYAKGKWK